MPLAPSRAQTTYTETVLHNFPSPPKGADPYAGVIRDSAGSFYGTTGKGGAANAGLVYKVNASGHQTVLYSFTGGADGGEPYAGVIADPEGNLYGTTQSGGAANAGVVYKVDTAGHETVLYSFIYPDGFAPYAGVIRDSAGNLYGTTPYGGSTGAGVVYEVDTAGQETVLYNFTGGADGSTPFAGVIRDSQGNLYGTTYSGGAASAGVVYKLDIAGNETVLYSFTGKPDGSAPFAGVIRDSAGNLYGTTYSGGAANAGIVYKLDTTGQETILYSFTGGADGDAPNAGVIRDPAGNLYGTTYYGGIARAGVVYKVDAAGQETVLYSFTGKADGSGPNAGVILDSSGSLYGTTFDGGTGGAGVVYKVDTARQETVQYSFPGPIDGSFPEAGVIRNSAGNFYGTTTYGGTDNAGLVYKLDPAGHETVLYSFTGGADGAYPQAGVIPDSAGNLYGTTTSGGAWGWGAVYKLDTTGQETVLYSFTGGVDGSSPYAGVIRDASSNLYGTTTSGGAWGWGAVYKLDTAGQETVLYSFSVGADGANPFAGVVRDAAGNLYGTAYIGGTANLGVVYKVDTAGQETVLHNFTGGSDGSQPYAGLVGDSSGNLYGTTYFGGAANAGVVYKLDTSGHETVLYTFTGGADGANPRAGAIRDSAGNLYGTTVQGGAAGVVYKVDPAGQETVLYSFTNGDAGGYPYSGVILDSAGNLYGTASNGGKGSNGLVFKLTPP
jgi:uncharacterized repeat protein (TIGR03803 family)